MMFALNGLLGVMVRAGRSDTARRVQSAGISGRLLGSWEQLMHVVEGAGPDLGPAAGLASNTPLRPCVQLMCWHPCSPCMKVAAPACCHLTGRH